MLILPIFNHIRACIASAAGILSWETDIEAASPDKVLSKRTDAPIDEVSGMQRMSPIRVSMHLYG